MPPRTYVPGLYRVSQAFHKYATRYLSQLNTNLTAPQYTALTTAISAVAALLVALGEPIYEGEE